MCISFRTNECLAFMQAYPFELNWDAIYTNTTLPLVVDVGSGKSLFPLIPSFSTSIILFGFEYVQSFDYTSNQWSNSSIFTMKHKKFTAGVSGGTLI